MCRSAGEGGRRCPCARGDRRRAYQRARYASEKVRAEYEGSHSPPVDTDEETSEETSEDVIGVEYSENTNEDDLLDNLEDLPEIPEMSQQQRDAVRDAARARIAAGQARAEETFQAIPESIMMSVEQFEAFHADRKNSSLLGSDDARRELVAAHQALGADVALAAECEYQSALIREGLDDAHVDDLYERRLASDPDQMALNRLNEALDAELAEAKAAGRASIAARLNPLMASSSEDLERPPVTNEELYEFLRRCHGDHVTEPEAIREALAVIRLSEQRTLQNQIYRTQHDYKVARFEAREYERGHTSTPYPAEELAAKEAAFESAKKAFEEYDPKPEDPAPRNDAERRKLESSLRLGVQSELHTGPGRVRAQINAERARLQRDTLVAELRRVQTFGGEVIEPIATGGKVSKAIKKTFSEATDLYPSGLVAEAVKRYPALVLRQTSKRAHFSDGRIQEWSQQADQYIAVPSLAGDPEDAFSDSIEFFYDDPDDPRGVAGRGHQNTPENKAKLEAIVAAHNSGRTRMHAEGARGRYGTSKPRVLVVAEVPDPDYGSSLVVKAKNKVSQKRYGRAAELTTDGSESTTIHELGHMMESDPRVFYSCKQFLHDRTRGKESIVYNRSRKHGTEMTVPDGFANSYVGKDYMGTTHTEVFSVGMEGIFAQGRGGVAGVVPSTDMAPKLDKTVDTEHRDLILGILAGYRRPGSAAQ